MDLRSGAGGGIASIVRRFLGRGRSAPPPATGITAEHVVWGYRLFLDREPENEEVVEGKVRTQASTRALRFDFMSSYEFRTTNPELGYISKRTVVLAEIGDGLRLFLDLADSVVSLDIARGTYEPDERAFVELVVRSGDVVLDIGANLGFHTVRLAAAVGDAGRVYAFEPFPDNAELLERSLAENGFAERVMVERAAVADVGGTATFVIGRYQMNSGGGYISEPGGERPPGALEVEVPVFRLDDLPIRRPLAFVKIDVEGAEALALQGGATLLRDDRPIVMSEINTRQLRIVSGMLPVAFIAQIEQIGYETFLLRGGRLVRDDGDLNREGVRTVVFVPRPPSALRDRVSSLIDQDGDSVGRRQGLP